MKKPKMLICENCKEEFIVTHGLMKFCNKKCKNEFHNENKKENRLEADFMMSVIKKDEATEEFQNWAMRNWKVDSDKSQLRADNLVILQQLEIPSSGSEVTTEFLFDAGFDIDAYDNKVQIRQTPYNVLEYGDYGLFWTDTNKVLITNKKDYLLWI